MPAEWVKLCGLICHCLFVSCKHGGHSWTTDLLWSKATYLFWSRALGWTGGLSWPTALWRAAALSRTAALSCTGGSSGTAWIHDLLFAAM